MLDKLSGIEERFKELEVKIADPEVSQPGAVESDV